MLDPCSTSSYISEDTAEELELQRQELNLTIAGTGGTEVTTRSRRMVNFQVLCKLMSLTILLATLQLFAGQN